VRFFRAFSTCHKFLMAQPYRALPGQASGPKSGAGERCNWDHCRYIPREFAPDRIF